LQCMEAGGAGTGCSGQVSGTFGSLVSPRLRSHFVTSSPTLNNILKLNYAVGIDHGLQTDTALPGRVCDGPVEGPCLTANSSSNPLANHLPLTTGNNLNEVTDGLISGGSTTTSDDLPVGSRAYCGRLKRPERTDTNISQLVPSGGCVATPPTISVVGHTINGHHIHMWLTTAAKAIFYPSITTTPGPAISHPPLTSPATDAYSAGDTKLSCFLAGYSPVTKTSTCASVVVPSATPIFVADIVNDPRYGTVPVVVTTGSGANTVGAIKRFKGSFVYKLWTNATKVQSFNGFIFDLSLIDPGSTPLGSASTPIVHLSK
jgi:hypothetical protein